MSLLKYSKYLLALSPLLVNITNAQVIQQVDTDGNGVSSSSSSSDKAFSLSPDGQYAVFVTRGDNIHGGGTSGDSYIVLKNLSDESISVLDTGSENIDVGSFSADSSVLAYLALDTVSYSITAKFYDMSTGTTTTLTDSSNNPVLINSDRGVIELSSDGRYALFNTDMALTANDLNSYYPYSDYYLYDRQNDTFRLVTKGYNGLATGFDYSGKIVFAKDGDYLVWSTESDQVVSGYPVNSGETTHFVIEAATGNVINIIEGGPYQTVQNISDDGSIILITDPYNGGHVLVYETLTGNLLETLPVTNNIHIVKLSGDGRYAFFVSYDTLASEDVSLGDDIYVYEIGSNNPPALVSIAADGTQLFAGYFGSTREVYIEDISADGKSIIFSAYGSYFDPADYYTHIFLANNPLFSSPDPVDPTNPSGSGSATAIPTMPFMGLFAIFAILIGAVRWHYYRR
ncbi:MAG: YncE family protein [Parahaliea sp.]